jgi:hypothetical protein
MCKRFVLILVLILILFSMNQPVKAGNIGHCEYLRYVGWVGVVGGFSDHVLYPHEGVCRENLLDGLEKMEPFSPHIARRMWA